MSDPYSTGKVLVANGSRNWTGIGTLWLTNKALTLAGGYVVCGPDDHYYLITSVSSDGTLVAYPPYRGSDVTGAGGDYFIMPVSAGSFDLAQKVIEMMNGSYGDLVAAGDAGDDGDVLRKIGGHWISQTVLELIMAAMNDLPEVVLASAATVDLGSDDVTSLRVYIGGNVAITSFGTAANCWRKVRFGGPLLLTHNAASLILLGGASRSVMPGDVGEYASDENGNWREISFFSAAPPTYYCRMHLANNANLNYNQANIVPMDTIDFDPQNWCDAANHKGRITPKIAGKFRVTVSVETAATTGPAALFHNLCTANIAKNGAIVSGNNVVNQVLSQASPDTTIANTDIVVMNGTSDYIEPMTYPQNTGSQAVGSSPTTYITVEYLGP